jgi:hypothetical protein
MELLLLLLLLLLLIVIAIILNLMLEFLRCHLPWLHLHLEIHCKNHADSHPPPCNARLRAHPLGLSTVACEPVAPCTTTYQVHATSLRLRSRSIILMQHAHATVGVALILLLRLLLASAGSSSTQSILNAAAAAFSSNDIELAITHAEHAWSSGAACEGLRMALWISHGTRPPAGLFHFISRCNGVADSGDV